MMTALWTRNAIGATVAVAALAVFVVCYLRPEWSTYRQTVQPPHVVPAGQSLAVDGLTWRVSSVRHLASSPGVAAPALPQGTVLSVVSIERSGDAAGQSCVGVLTDGDRRWRAQVVGVYTVLPPDGVTGNCSKSGPVQFTFVLPQDAVPTAVDITTADGQIMLRLLL
jgi:hypothetical protein